MRTFCFLRRVMVPNMIWPGMLITLVYTWEGPIIHNADHIIYFKTDTGDSGDLAGTWTRDTCLASSRFRHCWNTRLIIWVPFTFHAPPREGNFKLVLVTYFNLSVRAHDIIRVYVSLSIPYSMSLTTPLPLLEAFLISLCLAHRLGTMLIFLLEGRGKVNTILARIPTSASEHEARCTSPKLDIALVARR